MNKLYPTTAIHVRGMSPTVVRPASETTLAEKSSSSAHTRSSPSPQAIAPPPPNRRVEAMTVHMADVRRRRPPMLRWRVLASTTAGRLVLTVVLLIGAAPADAQRASPATP